MPVNPNFRYLRHLFGGGWATGYGPATSVQPNGDEVQIPYLVNADNVFYELDGGPHLEYGTTALNSSALESGATVKGIYDFWLQGGSPAQHRIIHVGTKVYRDDGDGTFTSLFTGLSSGAVPSYSQFDDIAIIANDADVPKSWDGTTAQNLAGSPPNFAFSVVHSSSLFAAGVDAAPSTLYYSVPFDPEDWGGAGSGTIQIDPNDGDRITGLASYKGNLIVFKGPYKGSIHVITGTSSANFAHQELQRGIGAVWQNSITPYGDDLAFLWSDGHIYSLQATNAFGNFRQAAQLTAGIASYINEHYNFGRLRHAWLTTWASRGIMLLTVPVDSADDPNVIIMLDYRFTPMRLALWSDFDDYACLALVIDGVMNNRPVVMGGAADGFVYKFGFSTRSLKDVGPMNYRVTTPYFNYGSPLFLKTISAASLSIAPHNEEDITFAWSRDDEAQQTRTTSQSSGSDVLAPSSTNPEFTLGTSALGGASGVDRYMDLDVGGQFRTIQYEVRQGIAGADLELHGIGAAIQINGVSLEN